MITKINCIWCTYNELCSWKTPDTKCRPEGCKTQESRLTAADYQKADGK